MIKNQLLTQIITVRFPLAYAQHKIFPQPFSRKRYMEVYTSSPRPSSSAPPAPPPQAEKDAETDTREVEIDLDGDASKASLQSVIVTTSLAK